MGMCNAEWPTASGWSAANRFSVWPVLLCPQETIVRSRLKNVFRRGLCVCITSNGGRRSHIRCVQFAMVHTLATGGKRKTFREIDNDVTGMATQPRQAPKCKHTTHCPGAGQFRCDVVWLQRAGRDIKSDTTLSFQSLIRTSRVAFVASKFVLRPFRSEVRALKCGQVRVCVQSQRNCTKRPPTAPQMPKQICVCGSFWGRCEKVFGHPLGVGSVDYSVAVDATSSALLTSH